MCLLVESAKVVQETKRGARRQQPTTTIVVVVYGRIILHFLWCQTKPVLTIIAMQLGVTRPTKPKQKN